MMVGLLIASVFSFSYPMVLIGSLIPDLDILIPFLEHRGFTHSLLFVGILFIITRLKDRKKAIMLALGMFSHLITDSLTYAGLKLLWPLEKTLGLSLVAADSSSANLLLISISLIVFWNRRTLKEMMLRIKSEKIRKATYILIASWAIILIGSSLIETGTPTSLVIENSGNLKNILNNPEKFDEEKVTARGEVCSPIEERYGGKFRTFQLCQKDSEIKIWDLKENDSIELQEKDEVTIEGKFTTKYDEPEIYYVESIKKE